MTTEFDFQEWMPQYEVYKDVNFIMPVKGYKNRGWIDMPHNCRNYSLPYLKALNENKNHFAVSVGTDNQLQMMIIFLHDWEKYLGYTPSKFRIVPKKNILVFEFNANWTQTPIRASFLLFLLKVGVNYDGTGIDNFFFSRSKYSFQYMNTINTLQTIQSKIRVIINKKSLESMDKYSWDDVNNIYESDIGFISTNYDVNKRN